MTKISVLALALVVFGVAANTDLSELATLTGDTDYNTNLTEPVLAKLGWKRAVVVTYNVAVGRTGPINDQVVVYEKNKDCMVTFQAVNDESDSSAMLGGFDPNLAAVDLCSLQVHPGIASKMSLFLNAPEKDKVVAYLNDNATCATVTSLGQSLGASLATLWATCTNQGHFSSMVGARQDYKLVTFAPVAISRTPAFNGVPGKPFVGTRYCVTESDGGSIFEANFHVDEKVLKEFRIEVTDLYSKVAAGINQTGLSAQLAGLKTQLSNLTSKEIESMWRKDIAPQNWGQLLGLVVFQLAQGSSDMSRMIQATILKLAASGVLSFRADPVCSLGQFFGYSHAVQDFQPIPNKLIPNGDPDAMPFLKVPASDSAALVLPTGDLFQYLFAILASNGGFANHNTCCYAAGSSKECSEQYTTPEWRTCNNLLMAYWPKKDEEKDMTCGSIKEAYKEQGCCGQPTKKFTFGRRLVSAPGESMHDSDVFKMIRDVIGAAKAKGDQKKVDKLVDQVRDLIRQFL